MDITSLWTGFWATTAPLLPDAGLMRWSLHGIWGVLLGAAVLRFARPAAQPRRWFLVLGVFLWSMLPGSVSPAHWLGLAFQSPSLMSAVVCLSYLWQKWRGPPELDGSGVFKRLDGPILLVSGAALGWLLLLDALAWWPASVYAWGFGSLALAALCGLTLLLWLLAGTSPAGQGATATLAVVLGLFVLTRLPTGNVWDALLDPCLWLILQVRWLVDWVHGRIKVRREAATTHV